MSGTGMARQRMGGMARARGTPAPASFYWYDLETSGTHPASDRIMQFAGRRTDTDLQVVDEPYVTYIRLGPEVLPTAESCLITGITPQKANAEGVDEWQAMRQIDATLRVPGTCVVGYNNLRFDDEFLRHALYRNLMDPYAREWQEGNSRWDLIDLVRATCALRPDGVNWPKDEEGIVTFALERLCAANGIDHGNAHDALADVHATLGFARIVRKAQPKLWNYALGQRFRHAAGAMLMPLGENLCVHVSNRYPNRRFCTAPVASVAIHPQFDNRYVVADLSRDISQLMDCDATELAERLFAQDLPEEEERPPIKVVQTNRCPFLAPINVVREQDAGRLGFDLRAIEHRRKTLKAMQPGIAEKIAEIYRPDEERGAAEDAELGLYDGFVADADRFAMERLGRALAAGAPWPDFQPRDKRLRTLAERLKARIRPADLSSDELERWRGHVERCLAEGFGRRQSLADFTKDVADKLVSESDPARRGLLDELAAYEPQP